MKQKAVVAAGNEWIEKNVREFSGSPFDRIHRDWMLISAGNTEKDKSNWNTMTASWGCLGVLWRRDVAIMFVRPSRLTFDFVNESGIFSLSFFNESYKDALTVCGRKSGRDIDKAAETGLNPVVFTEGPIAGAVSFKEASDIIFCKKIYAQDIDPSLFLARESIEECYHGKDYHRIYVGEILGYRTKIS